MRKLIATVKALVEGGATIESVGKSRISKPPGDSTQMPHN